MEACGAVARCIKIASSSGKNITSAKSMSDGSLRYNFDKSLKITLKSNTGDVDTFGANYVADKIRSGQLEVTNLMLSRDKYGNNISLVRDRYTLLNIHLEDKSIEAQDKAMNMLNKSKLVGAYHLDEYSVIPQDIYDKLIITDKSNRLGGNIVVGELWIYGSIPLGTAYSIGLGGFLTISCDKVVIQNHMAMGILSQDTMIRLNAKYIEIKHRFIDINTAMEMLSFYDREYLSSDRKDIHLDIYIQFDESDYDDIRDIVIKTLDTRLSDYSREVEGFRDIKKLVSALSWGVCMWKSIDKPQDVYDRLTKYREHILIGLFTDKRLKTLQVTKLTDNVNSILQRYL